MKTARRRKRRGRPKGSGVLKFIDPEKQDFDTIERMLHRGEPLVDDTLAQQWAAGQKRAHPLRIRKKAADKVAEFIRRNKASTDRVHDAQRLLAQLSEEIDSKQQEHDEFLREFAKTLAKQYRQQLPQQLFLYWRGLVEQRDDCERRIREKHNSVTKWTRRRLAGLRKQVAEAWQRLGQSLERMNTEQRSAALAAMSRAEQQQRQSVFRWQEAATRLLKTYVWLDKSSSKSKVLPLTPAGKAVDKCAREITATLRAGGYKIHEDGKTATDMVRRFVVEHLRMTLKSERNLRP